jgi:hypothetical protein
MENGFHHFINRIHSEFKALRIYQMAIALFLAFCILYLVFSLSAPVKTFRIITSDGISEYDKKWNLGGMNKMADSLLERSVILDSRLSLSQNDSIAIFVSLPDSLLNLVLQGVTIHQSKISHIGSDRLLSKPGKASLYKYLSAPLMIKSYRSSIVKIPVVIKHAPKDTSEANSSKYVPQLPPDEYVKYSLYTDKLLKIIIQQEEKVSGKQRLTALAFKCSEKANIFAGTAFSIFKFRIPDYYIYIHLKIPGNDARTIFRALPENASLVLEL